MKVAHRQYCSVSTAVVSPKRQVGDFLALDATTDLQATWSSRWEQNGQMEKLEKHWLKKWATAP